MEIGDVLMEKIKLLKMSHNTAVLDPWLLESAQLACPLQYVTVPSCLVLSPLASPSLSVWDQELPTVSVIMPWRWRKGVNAKSIQPETNNRLCFSM